MSIRAWVFTVAIGLIAGLGAAQEQPTPENQPRLEDSATDAHNQSADNFQRPIDYTTILEGIEGAIRDLKTEVDKTEQKRQSENSRRDLHAQEDMAFWAKWMFISTFATVILTAIALWAIIRTLHHTRRAAKAAEDMTDEARKSTSAAFELVNLETQPFLTVELIDGHKYRIKDGVIGVETPDGFHKHPLQFRIVNGGRSSAISAKIFRRWDFTDAGDKPQNIDRSAPPVEDRQARLTEVTIPVGPQSHSAIMTFSDQIGPARKSFTYFHGFIEFSDTSGKQRGRTGFCYIYVDRLGERGFHVAMPNDPGQHWYHERLES